MGSGLTRRSAKPLKIFVFPPRTSLIAAFVQIVPRRLIPALAPLTTPLQCLAVAKTTTRSQRT